MRQGDLVQAGEGAGHLLNLHRTRSGPRRRSRPSEHLLSMAFRTPKPTDAEKDAAIDEAFKHLGEP